ncbi:MAG: hypothetical protein Q8896_08390, partial [Bacteroidota bacterium]|nr:hypothetical protein [Bacteroidota bacterium]
MKTNLQTLVKTIACCLLVSFLMLGSTTSSARITSTLLSEDFSSATEGGFPPGNWYTDGYGYWYGSAYGPDMGTGDGGYNGSAMYNMNGVCGSENLYSPVIDASAYGGAGSTVTIDFDYWWEANFYDANFGSNTVTIYANGESG